MQQWLNMQMCFKASVLCRPWSSTNCTLLVRPIQCLELRYNRTDVDDTAVTTRGYKEAKLLAYRLQVESHLWVVAGRKGSESCSDQVYSECDSWTSSYRPHITQEVNLWLVVDLNLYKALHWQHILYPVTHFWCKLCLAETVKRQLFQIHNRRSGQPKPKDSLMQQKRTRK